MLTKKIFFVLFLVGGLFQFSWGQNKMYLEYNNDCMKRLEYKTLNGTQEGKEIHYHASSAAGTTLVLKTNPAKMIRFASKPTYMLTCNKMNFDETLLRRANTGQVIIMMVAKDNKGYIADYVESVGIIKDNGQTVTYESFADGFSYNKSDFINPTANLSSGKGVNQMVMYRGETGLECLRAHTFRQTSTNTCGPYTDITFNDKIGLLQTIHYKNPQFVTAENDIEGSSQLVYINNLPVDNYLGAFCQGKMPRDPMQNTTTIVKVVPNEFENKGESSAPAIANVPTPPAPAPRPSAPKEYKPSTSVPAKVSKPKPQLKNRAMTDFSDGIPAGSTHGEPIAPIENYVSKCALYKREGFHIVKPDETLYSISKMTGVKLKDLVAWNNITDGKTIHECNELRLTAPHTPQAPKKKIVKDKITLDDLESKGGDTAVKVNKKPAQEEGYHVVKEGETIYTIALKYGYTAKRFMEFNDLTSDIVTPKMVLKTSDCACDVSDYKPKLSTDDIPQTYNTKGQTVSNTTVFHTVKEGETLYRISQQYKVSVPRIKALNNITDAKDVSIGTKLRIK